MAKTRCEICQRNFKNEESLAMHNMSKHTVSEIKHEKSKKPKKVILIVIVLLILVGVMYFTINAFASLSKYDTFAQCISDSGAKFYGAYWCPHCEEEKGLFGNSWKKLPYVECSLPNRAGQNAVCNASNIESYPTWVFPDGSTAGYMTMQQLSDKTGCPLVEDQ